MDAIDALVNRVSCGKLTAPAPSREQRQSLYQAALRAADHGNLRPWRFLEVEGDNLAALGAVFERAALADDADLTESQRDRFLKMPCEHHWSSWLLLAVKSTQKCPSGSRL